jgi:hypothetical protein
MLLTATCWEAAQWLSPALGTCDVNDILWSTFGVGSAYATCSLQRETS